MARCFELVLRWWRIVGS
uniref:Uncharacterized protein n=1 Tax=Arundo donax TaxID=35708 RepID=A0A0A9BUE9_ARUDO